MTNQEKQNPKAVGFYLGLAGGVLAAAALVFDLPYAAATAQWNPLVLLPLAAAVVLTVLSFFRDSDLITIACPVLCTVALCAFVIESINTLVGYFLNLDMFGDASTIGSVAQVSVCAGAAVILLVAGSFLKKSRTE